MTAALEKSMSNAVEFGLVFPSAKTEASQAEARVTLKILLLEEVGAWFCIF